jgi:hypothetical protein
VCRTGADQTGQRGLGGENPTSAIQRALDTLVGLFLPAAVENEIDGSLAMKII